MVQQQAQADPLAELGLMPPQGPSQPEAMMMAFPGQQFSEPLEPPEQVMAPMPPEVVDQDVVQAFWQQHGRAPTARDMQLAHGGAQLELRLGRAPSRAELMDFLDGRDLTITAQQPQFEIAGPIPGPIPGQVPGPAAGGYGGQ